MQHDMEISDPAAGRSISSFCTSDKPSNMKAKDCPFKPTLASTCSSTSAISAAGSMGSKKGESASQSKLSAFEVINTALTSLPALLPESMNHTEGLALAKHMQHHLQKKAFLLACLCVGNILW